MPWHEFLAFYPKSVDFKIHVEQHLLSYLGWLGFLLVLLVYQVCHQGGANKSGDEAIGGGMLQLQGERSISGLTGSAVWGHLLQGLITLLRPWEHQYLQDDTSNDNYKKK